MPVKYGMAADSLNTTLLRGTCLKESSGSKHMVHIQILYIYRHTVGTYTAQFQNLDCTVIITYFHRIDVI